MTGIVIAFVLGELFGVIMMAVLSGRLDRRMELKEKKKAADVGASAAKGEQK